MVKKSLEHFMKYNWKRKFMIEKVLTNTAFNRKIREVENKIPDISSTNTVFNKKIRDAEKNNSWLW